MERKVALITGASRGIGRCGALSLAARGFDVAITARTLHEGDGRAGTVVLPGSLDRTAEEIRAIGREALPVGMDITDRESILSGYRTVIDAWGEVGVLVNNAPYSGPGSDEKLLDINLEHATALLAGNYLNQLYLTQLILPGMLDKGHGTVINLGSGSALVAPPAPAGEGGWSLAYCASKAAFHQLAVVADVEYREAGIRAFNLEPGYTVTERHEALGAGQRFSQGFHGDPPEVAGEVIGWLAGDPIADRFRGKMVHAQALCAKYDLVPGWSPQQ